MSRFWNPLVQTLSPYVPGEQPIDTQLVKLNTNEMPFGPSELALEAMRAAASDDIRLYPDPGNRRLCEAFAEALDISPEQVFPGNGSDEVLAHTFRALFQPDAPLLFPDISYSFYPVYAAFFGLSSETIPLRDDFAIELSDFRRPNGGIIFPNPNAPTGMGTSRTAIEALLRENPDTVVVVDEAYVDFGAESAIPLIDQYPNLLVVQTLSKSRALAGLRVGAAFGQRPLIEGLERVKNSFNSYPVDRIAEAGAVAALEDAAWFEARKAEIIENRRSLTEGLETLGFEVLPSQANFVFARREGCQAASLQRELRERRIVVRHFDKPRISDYLRITVGTAEQCDQVLKALRELI
ncbi:MAG: histidinol-phosphate transaminase [Pseudomonadota bacterium]